jgi:O-antigen/teichoic acid export membrane protein
LFKTTQIIDGKGVASLARNLTYLLAGRGVYFITRFIYVVILARVLGPKAYGMINYGIAWYLLFLPLTSMGLAVVLSRDVGKDRQQGNHTAALTLTLRIVSIIMATAAYLILSFSIESDPASRLLVCVFTFALIGRSLAVWTENVYTAYEVNQYSFRQQSIFRSLEVVLGLLVLIVWQEALPVVMIHGLVWCLEAVYGLTMIHHRVFPLRLEMNFADLSRIFLQGVPLGIAMLLMALPNQGPLIFFRHIASASNSLGQLALAMQAFIILSYIPFALGSVVLPALSRSVDKEDGKDRLFVETALRFSLLSGTVLILLGTAFGPRLTVQIFGDRYAQAGALIGPVLWLMIPWAANQTLTGVLIAGKQDRSVLFCSLMGALFFLLIISKAVWMYYAVGAIWAATAAMSMTTVCLIIAVHKQMKLDLCSSLIKPGLAFLLSTVTYYVLCFISPVTALVGAFITMLAISYWFQCLTPQDKAWCRQLYGWIVGKISSAK